MQWSKLKASVRRLICAELRPRIDFHITTDHSRRSARSRYGLITIDGQPVLRLSYDRFCHKSDGWFAVRRETGVTVGPGSEEWQWSPLQCDEIHPPQQLGDAMRAYLDMPIGLAIKSSNPFIRSLAIVDRRIGRRTLADLSINETDHSLIRAFYRLRMSAAANRASETA